MKGAVSQPSLWVGACLAGILLVSYLYSIRGLPLSVAYVVATSLSIAGIVAAGVLIYGETLAPRANLGIIVVASGVILISTS